jgi:hypothetical protein
MRVVQRRAHTAIKTVGLRARQSTEELLVCFAQPRGQFTPKLCASIQQSSQGAPYFGHAHEGSVVLGSNILVVAEQYFVNWPIVSGQIDHEALHHAFGDAARFVELPYVEQIARVLPVERGRQLARRASRRALKWWSVPG